ncbi:abortive infection family protein [Rhodococcus sp. ARC_M6]|uniref:abortive infection family protein n=1 Tax=Rhodococcus sp. ARC_M6 TaxID=2928852 RepID=UPI001FB51E9B|nr:abortive infection family protein [Rhodococcus sp. ARC_M6]MCJ0905254.1 abortive infection family protein [Rhodococcus sp. ARC_M6]
MAIGYGRFDIKRPPHMPQEHWASVEREIERLSRALDADDGAQAIADLKCLVECIAKIVLELDGNPAASNAVFDGTVKQAHSLLSGQPGDQLANKSAFGQMATQASKIAQNLGGIRNEYGGGHGRARVPNLDDEMVVLSLDGGLLWARWALRRIGYFAIGRPGPLIEALVGNSRSNFESGMLKARLLSADLPNLEPRYQRSIGMAVGQRVMRETFVVRVDGLNPVLASDSLLTWPRDYRIGLAHGLWFDPDGNLTLTPASVQEALSVLEPVPDCADDLTGWVDQIEAVRPPGELSGGFGPDNRAQQFVLGRIAARPAAERSALKRLAANI